ncbi:MAG: hydrogen gas-evolving membrane-bound hydrogenase subunit E [Alkalispirochaeta sp.]
MRNVVSMLLILGFTFYLVTFLVPTLSDVDDAGRGVAAEEIIATNAEETGSANVVTAVVVQFRGLDTLGEVTVLFVSALGVALFAGALQDGAFREMYRDGGGFVLQAGSRLLLPVIVMIGAYIVAHGHLSPGGGFPGGVLIATAVLVLLFTRHEQRLPHPLLAIFEGLAGIAFVAIGLAGLYGRPGSFLANVLPLGSFGTLFSAGSIPVLYAIVAVKVASELSNLVSGISGLDDHEEVEA